jgi:hypothetical protein
MPPSSDSRGPDLREGPRHQVDEGKAERVTAMIRRYREAPASELPFDAIRRLAAGEDVDQPDLHCTGHGCAAPVRVPPTMADSQSEPRTDMAAADAANGEPEAMEATKPSVKRALAGDEVRDDEVEHPTGEKQAEANRDNEPPA